MEIKKARELVEKAYFDETTETYKFSKESMDQLKELLKDEKTTTSRG